MDFNITQGEDEKKNFMQEEYEASKEKYNMGILLDLQKFVRTDEEYAKYKGYID